MKKGNFYAIVMLACMFSVFSYAQDDNDDVHNIVLNVPEVALSDLFNNKFNLFSKIFNLF